LQTHAPWSANPGLGSAHSPGVADSHTWVYLGLPTCVWSLQTPKKKNNKFEKIKKIIIITIIIVIVNFIINKFKKKFITIEEKP
jgi:hypothetical protein